MEPQEPPSKRRNPWLAGIGSYFFPPLGHVYAGQPGRGLLLLAGVTAIWAMALWVAARSVAITQLQMADALAFAGGLWMAADAAIAARRQSGAPLHWYQRWQFYLATAIFAIGFVVTAVFGIIRPFLAQAYYTASGAMSPTLRIGDRFIIDKLTYRWKDPERGDVVVFRAPPQASPEEHDWVKRVIGLPGETVAVVPDTLLVDGKPAVELNDSVGDPSANFQHTLQHGLRWLDREQSPRLQDKALFENSEPRVVVTASGQVELRDDQLWANGQRLAYVGGPHQFRVGSDLAPFGAAPGVQGSVYYLPQSDQPALIVLQGKRLILRPGWVSINGQPLKEPYARQSPRYEMPPYRIPAGYYFVLGDNRNDSNDSHAWGPVSRHRISGVAHMIFWSDQPDRSGRPL